MWRAFSPELAKSESGEAAAVARKLAKESLALCLAALQTCDHQSFMYALLLNHCVYMAAVTRLIDPTSELLFQELIQLRYARRDALSYRVDDTIAYFYYVRARNTWELSARSCHTTPAVERACRG